MQKNDFWSFLNRLLELIFWPLLSPYKTKVYKWRRPWIDKKQEITKK